MKLVAINANVLVNPDSIDYVEQKKVKTAIVTIVCVAQKEFILAVPLVDFYKNLGFKEQSSGDQYFAG